MIDFREYKDLIRELVKKEDKADENWKWSVTSIGKKSVKINWSYLDWGQKRYPFEICGGLDPETVEEAHTVIGIIPNGHKEYIFVGDKSWDDARTVADAIRIVIRSMAGYAHSRY